MRIDIILYMHLPQNRDSRWRQLMCIEVKVRPVDNKHYHSSLMLLPNPILFHDTHTMSCDEDTPGCPVELLVHTERKINLFLFSKYLFFFRFILLIYYRKTFHSILLGNS